MSVTEILKDIYWVGAIDWNVRDFHGYLTGQGTTYNSFLIMDEKITLVDTVKKEHKGELLHNIHKITDPSKIDYLIINHVELDHSGSLPAIINLIKPEKIFCSPMGKKALLEHFHAPDWPYEIVSTGDQISLGKRTIQFLETKMLHWPDSMFSYIPEDKLLFSSDAFGQHWATSERFDDEMSSHDALMANAAKYYANILMLFSPLVAKLLAQVKQMGIECKMIAPDHGIIWRKAPEEIIKAYDRWSKNKTRNKAVVIYDTMWNSTETMAKAIISGLSQTGVTHIKMLHARRNHRSDIITEIMDARAIIMGSPTLNNNMMPALADILTYMKGLRPKNKIGAAFGSYGWSGEAVKHLNSYMEKMKFELIDPGVKIKNVPNHETLQNCVALGRQIGKKIVTTQVGHQIGKTTVL